MTPQALQTVTKNTVIIVYSPTIVALSDWEQAVSMGIMFVEERDRWSWALGELASYMRTSAPAGGRPRTSDRLGTLSAFADDIGMRRESISAMAANFEFYQAMRDEIPENATWYQLSEARRRSGWRPGAEIEQEHQAHALEFVNAAVDGDHRRPKRTVYDRIAAEYDRLTALEAREDARLVAGYISAAAGELRKALQQVKA